MNHHDLYVLEGLNIASTRFKRPGHTYEATAAQIAEVMREEYGLTWPTGVTIGAKLGQMRNRSEPLVEKVDRRRWRLASAGLKVLAA